MSGNGPFTNNFFSDLLLGYLSPSSTEAYPRDAVWQKGRAIQGWNPAEWRMDALGGLMRYAEYGQTTAFGWEIDHINPDRADELWNLQPLYWLNNRRKSDKPLGSLPPLDGLFGFLMKK